MTEAEPEGQHAGGLGEPGSQLGWQDPEAELVSVQNSTKKQVSSSLLGTKETERRATLRAPPRNTPVVAVQELTVAVGGSD